MVTKTFKDGNLHHESMDARKLMNMYRALESSFGGGIWWPHETPYEVMVGAILTQQTVWRNVEKAIRNLKREGLMDPKAQAAACIEDIENCVRPSGFYKQKAERLHKMAKYLADNYQGDPARFFRGDVEVLRRELLSLKGIGPETADSILLYAGGKPKFVVDAYTYRIFSRLGYDFGMRYEKAQGFFEKRLPRDVELYRNFHAYIVELAKNYCRPKPLCSECPINNYCEYYE